MRGVGVLILIDQYVFEFAVIFLQHIRIGAENPDRMAEQVAEIAGIQRRQPVLIGLEKLPAPAIGEGARVALGDLSGAEALVLPAVDHHGELARRPALVIQPLGLDELLEEPHDVVGVENGEIALQPGKFRMSPQQLDADGMERAEPRHALDGLADQHADAGLHLARGLVGESHGQDLARECKPGGQDMGNAGGEHAGLAGSGARQHQHRAFRRLDGKPLLRIEALEITRG